MQDSDISANYQFKMYTKTSELPLNWDKFTRSNLFLQSNFLHALQCAPPQNSTHYFVGVFKKDCLIGALLFQHIRLRKLPNILHESSSFSRKIRVWFIKNLASGVLFCGNNLFSGHHGFVFSADISEKEQQQLLQRATKEVAHYAQCPRNPFLLICIKDFLEQKQALALHDFHALETQPMMVLRVSEQWHSLQDYVTALRKKYRLQYNRARNKYNLFKVIELTIDDLKMYENVMHNLYERVMQNAHFNTVVLPKNHFVALKQNVMDTVFFKGYFVADEMVGFITYFIHESVMETYFLGYNPDFQKTNLLYLNMLYDMVDAGIQNNVEEINFGRTALEIKSSIGCTPRPLYLSLRHKWGLLHAFLPLTFKRMEPEYHWKERHVFDEN